MKKFLIIVAMANIIALSLNACRSDETSSTKMIGTDLDENAEKGSPYLYWIANDQIFRGACDDRELYLRSTCKGSTDQMSYEVFKVKLENGLSETISELEENSVKLRSYIAKVEKQIARTKADIESAVEEQAMTEKEKEEVSQEMLKLEDAIQEYKLILAAIVDRLAEFPEDDLESQSGVMATELDGIRSELGDIYDQIEELVEKIAALKTKIKVLRKSLTKLGKKIEKLQKALDVVESDLEQAQNDFANYTNTIEKLEDDTIPYRATAANEWYDNNRPFIRRFAPIFDAN